MAVDVYVSAATEIDAQFMAPRVIQAEIDELKVSMGCTPLEALRKGVRSSAEAWTVWFNGQIACMWGVVRQKNGTGLGWLIATDLVERHPVTFWRTSLAILPAVLDRWPKLINAIDARHQRALRWGAKLGFEWGFPAIEKQGQQFIPFRVTKESHACARQRP